MGIDMKHFTNIITSIYTMKTEFVFGKRSLETLYQFMQKWMWAPFYWFVSSNLFIFFGYTAFHFFHRWIYKFSVSKLQITINWTNVMLFTQTPNNHQSKFNAIFMRFLFSFTFFACFAIFIFFVCFSFFFFVFRISSNSEKS